MSSLNLPDGDVACRLAMIDTGCYLVCASKYLIEPVQKGHEYLNLPTYSYLITNDRTGEQVLFDLGMRKDWDNSTPFVKPVIQRANPAARVYHEVPDVLKAGGVALENIKAAVLSHWHFDHSGNMSLFPKSVDAVVGPYFQKSHGPWYPEGKDSPFHAYEFEGRRLNEIDFSNCPEIGGLKAYDYFGDGSFNILHAPGHTKEHLAGFVRTTTKFRDGEDTFVYLGADSCHFAGVLRPTTSLQMPESIKFDPPLPSDMTPALPNPCPCSMFTVHHPMKADKPRETPFYKPSSHPKCFYIDPPQALETVQQMQGLESSPNVFVTIAHDPSLGEVMPLFNNDNKSTINDWKAKGYKDKVLWRWVKELPRGEERTRGMPAQVDGMYVGDQKIRETTKIEDL